MLSLAQGWLRPPALGIPDTRSVDAQTTREEARTLYQSFGVPRTILAKKRHKQYGDSVDDDDFNSVYSWEDDPFDRFHAFIRERIGSKKAMPYIANDARDGIETWNWKKSSTILSNRLLVYIILITYSSFSCEAEGLRSASLFPELIFLQTRITIANSCTVQVKYH